ncbi:MAG: hypothetical protein K6F14_05170 [Clostridiales bacterium]|nr:hypothetical protein [Clostridiales bacterium]
MSNKKVKYGYKPEKVNYKVFLFALVAVASTLLYVLSLSLTVEAGIFIKPMDFFSIVGLVVYLGFMFLWGWIGSVCAKSGIVFWKLMLGVNAFPIFCSLVYYVGLAICGTEAFAESIWEVIGAAGCGFASYTGTMLYYIVSVEFINYITVVLNLAFMLGVFALGFSFGTSKKSKKKQK